MKIFLSIIVIIAIAIGGWFVGKGLYVADQAGKVFEQTFNADNMIYNYEWFKRQYEDIVFMNQKIEIAQAGLDAFQNLSGDKSSWTFEDKQEYSKLSAIAMGLKSQQVAMIAEYNAKSRMANRNIFKSFDTVLPESISIPNYN